jgi:glycosyltransferase involved in cell wall biosynthesis
MIRIGCIFNHHTVIGGGEISFIDLAASLTSAEIVPVAIVPGRGEVAERLERLGIQVVETVFPRLTPLSLLSWHKRVRHLSRTFQELTIDLVHVNGARGMLYAGPAARRAGIPCIWHNRVLDRDPLLDRFRGRFADAVIANSKAVAQSLQKAGITNVSVVYNGFAIDALKKAHVAEIHREYQIAPEIPIILAVGRLCAWKGFDDLLEACGLLSKKSVPYFCMILGKSAPDEKRHVAALLERKVRLGLNNVHFAGWRDDVAAFMKAAAILAVPSHAEPFGRIVVEAWACGLPVVATNVGGPAEIIRHDENGVLVPPKNPLALADAIAKLLTDPLKRRSLAAAGLSSASDFTLERHRDAVVALYRKILNAASE